MKTGLALLIGAVAVLASAAGVNAQEYQEGHRALEIWNDDAMANSPIAIQAWLYTMLATFALGLLFAWRHYPPLLAVLGFVGMIFSMDTIAQTLGLTVGDGEVLSGYVSLMHIVFWSPALAGMLATRSFLRLGTWYGRWSLALTAVILGSFYFDVPLAATYLNHVMS